MGGKVGEGGTSSPTVVLIGHIWTLDRTQVFATSQTNDRRVVCLFVFVMNSETFCTHLICSSDGREHFQNQLDVS